MKKEVKIFLGKTIRYDMFQILYAIAAKVGVHVQKASKKAMDKLMSAATGGII